MNKSDFELYKFKEDGDHKDYWFKTSPQADEELCRLYSEQGLHHVFFVVYAQTEDAIGVEKQFLFNKYVDEVDNEELKAILKSIIAEGAGHGNNE